MRVPVLPAGVAVELASTRSARRRGLRGRTQIDGVMVLAPCRQVHTFGMRCAIDVAFVARDGEVLRVVTMERGRLSRVVWRSRIVLEGPAGGLASWGITRGIRLPMREHARRAP